MGYVAPYRNLVLALVVSLFNLYWAETRARDKTWRDNRAELRQIVQRLLAIPKENAQLRKLFPDDFYSEATSGGAIQVESSILALQASELAEDLDKRGLVAPVEHLAIAVALGQARHFDRARLHAERSLADARNSTEEAVALSLAGRLRYDTGDADGGRRYYKRMAELLIARDSPDQDAMLCNHYATWVRDEVALKNCPMAEALLRVAEDYAGKMVSSPAGDVAFDNLIAAREELDHCSIGAPNPSAPPDSNRALRGRHR